MNFLRKGSKKSLVKSISIVSDGNRDTERGFSEEDLNNLHQPEIKNVSTMNSTLQEQEIQRLLVENKMLENAKVSAEDKANYFENLLNEKEAEILSLSARIETLMIKIRGLEQKRANQLCEAKSQYVTNLEEELRKVREESGRTVTRLQRKMKKIQEKHAKSKEEYALKIFALKDEKKRLSEEIEAIQERLQLPEMNQQRNNAASTGNSRSHGSDVSADSKTGSRNELIVQLSQQVTSLDIENQELRKELEKANAFLNKLSLNRTRETREKSRNKHEQQQLYLNMASLDIGNLNSEVEILG